MGSYCHRIGRVGRQGAEGFALSFFTKSLSPMASGLVSLLERSRQEVDPNLRALAEGKVPGEDEEDAGEDDVENGKKRRIYSASTVTKAPVSLLYADGAAVRIHGLEKSPQLNGCLGHLKRRVPKTTGRWEVVIEASAEVKSLREQNLQLVPVKAVSSSKECAGSEYDASDVGGDGSDDEGSSGSDASAKGPMPSSGGMRIQPQK